MNRTRPSGQAFPDLNSKQPHDRTLATACDWGADKYGGFLFRTEFFFQNLLT